VDVFSIVHQQEEHPASKSLHQLPLTERTFSLLLFPSPVSEGHGGMVLKRMYGEEESKGN